MNALNKGFFIVFEGIDGSGKSTQIRILKKRLTELGIKNYETKEPTDSPIGSLIHQIMTGRIVADNKVIAGLFVADRVDHLLNKTDGILQQIENGITVVADRYYFSSYAYHSLDMDMDWVIQANSVSANILRPTVTIFLDVKAEKAIERIRQDRQNMELFEKEERLRAVREQYFIAFDKLKDVENVIFVNGEQTIEQVADEIWQYIKALFYVESK